MNSVAVLVVFTTLLVLSVLASVLMLRVAVYLEHRADQAQSILSCVLSNPDSFEEVCDLPGGDVNAELGSA